MKTLVLYDSKYGNTQQVAQEIADHLHGNVNIKLVSECEPEEISDYQLVIMGSPTHGAHASEPFQTFFKELNGKDVQGVSFGVFDTRLTWLFLRPFGYAAPRMAERIRSLEGKIIGKPAGFVVSGGEGPLKTGEMDRAREWALDLQETAAETFGSETRK